jgi:hypothetical protein
MNGRLTTHLRGHAIGYVALFIVLGGTAVALPGKNSVDSGDIAKKAVKQSDIAKKAVKKKHLASNAVVTNKIAANAVTGAKADEESFEGLVQGDGRQETVSYTEPAVGFLPQSRILAEVPGMGVIEFIACFPEVADGDADIRTRALAFDDAQPFFYAGTVISGGNPSGAAPGTTTDQTSGFLTAGGGNPLIGESAPGGIGVSAWWDWHIARGSGDDTVGAHVTASGFNDSTNATNGQCTVTATVEYQD